MADPRLIQLTTKTGVVKRLTKEKIIYENKVIKENKRLENFINEGADAHKLKEQGEVIMEYLMMLPDTSKRLKREYDILDKFVSDEKDLEYTQDYADATKVLINAKEALATEVHLKLQ